MTISALEAARGVCVAMDWQVDPLGLQKLLFLAHMHALGRSDGQEPLIDATFEAWMYGPVLPEVYRATRSYGGKLIEPIAFIGTNDVSERYQEAINFVVERFGHLKSGHLLALTHWPYGAWSDAYRSGKRNEAICDGSIYREYRERQIFNQKYRDRRGLLYSSAL